MSSKKRFEEQFRANKVKRVTNKNTKYNKKMSKSDENYIKGNYTKSVGQTVYGVKNSLAKGEKVHGYGDDYIDTKGMKRSRYVAKQKGENPYEAKYKFTGGSKTVKAGVNSKGEKYDSFTTNKRRLTKEEKESFKNTGILNHPDYRPKQKYAIMSSHKGEDAKKFSDHFNLGTLDGLRTAKANQRTGKHLSNALEWGKGLLKDTIVDAGVDAIRGMGAIGGYTTSAIAGAKTDLDNAISALTDPNRKLKDYTGGKSAFVENLKENKDELDKEGWGLGFGHYFKKDKERADKIISQQLKDKGKTQDLEKFENFNKKNEGLINNALNVAGFATDLFLPTPIEDGMFKVGKGLVKGAKQSFDDMIRGTADISTGILPKGASDSVFFSGKKGNTGIDRKLDNRYNKVVENTKDVVKTNIKNNPSTQNIAKYLDVIDKPLKGQTKIDGRTLNKKYTQTKDGYIPRYVGENNLYPVERPTQQLSRQYSMFGKSNSIENVDKYAENFIQKMDSELSYKRIPKSSNNVEEWARHVDSLSDEGYEKAMDYLKEHKPYIYDKLTRDEFAENIIDSAIDSYNARTHAKNVINEKIADEKNHKWFTTENQRNFNNPEARRIQENNYNLLKQILKPKEVLNKTLTERKSAFAQGTKNFIDNLGFKHIDELQELSQTLKDATNLTDNISRDNVVKMLNDLMFKGENIIRANIPKKDLTNILNTLEDNVNYHITKQNRGFKFEYRKDGQPKTFYMTDRQGRPVPFDHPMYKFSPTATDGHFQDKMSAMTSYFNIGSKSEFEEPLKAYRKALKDGKSLSPEEFKEYERLSKIDEEWRKIYSELKNLEGSDYYKYAQDRLNRQPEVLDVLDELDKEEKAKELANNKKAYLDKQNDYGSDPDVTASPRVQAEMARKQDVKDFEHLTQNFSTGNIKNQINVKDKIEYGKSIGLKYVNTKYGVQIPKNKQTFKNVYSNKNVKNAVDNLLTLMNKEVTLVKGANYKEEYAKIRLLVNDNIKYLDNLGIDRKVYFNKIKEQKLKLLDTLRKDMQIGTNTRGTKPMSGTVKNTTKNIKNPLESLHLTVNGNILNKMDELTPDQLQWQYLMTQGAKTIDELFDIPDANLLQRGDNIGDEISSSLRQNNTPLDDFIDENPFDSDENPFDSFDDVFDEPYSTPGNISNDEVVTMDDFFKKLKQNANKVDDTPISEPIRETRPIPSPSELMNLGMTREQAFDAINKMMSGEMEIPDLRYDKKVGRDGYVRYERKGIDLGNPFDNISREPLDYSTVPRTQKELDRLAKDNAIRERRRVGSGNSIEFKLDDTPLPKPTNAPNMSDYDSKQLQGVLRHGTPQEKRIARRLLEGRGVEIPNEPYNVKSGESELDKILRTARENENNVNVSGFNGVDPSRGTYDMSGIDYSTIPKSQKELDRLAKDNALRERRRTGGGERFEYKLDKTYYPPARPANAPNMSNYDDKHILSVMKNGTPQEKRIARRLLEVRGITVPNELYNVKSGESELDKILRIARENEGNVNISNFNGADPNRGNYNMNGIDYSQIPRTQKELDKLARDNSLREHSRVGSGKRFEYILDKTYYPPARPANPLNMSNYDNKHILSVMKNGTPQEKRIARRLADIRGIDISEYDVNIRPNQISDVPSTQPTPQSNQAPMSFEEFVRESGLDVEDIKNSTYESGEEEIYGIPLTNAEIRGNERKLNRLPYENNELYDIYKSYLNTWKKGLTVYNPGWHVQNYFQNKGQNYLALGAEAFAPQTEARQVLKNIQGKSSKGVNIVDNVNGRSYSTDEISKLAQDLGVVGGFGEDIDNTMSIFPRLENAIDNSKFMKKLNESEQTARLHHFITQLRRGMTPEQASQSVNKYLFDYGNKSKLDKFISDFIDPFWMFHKNNARLMTTSAFENAGRMNNIIRGTRGLEHGIPEGTEQNENSKYGKLQMPYANMTDRVNNDDYNYLFSENMMPDFEDAFPIQGNDYENNLNPLLRIALQQSRNEGNFGNEIVEGDTAEWGEVTKRDRAEEIFKDLFPLMQPLNKTVSSVKERREKEEQGRQSKEVTDRQVFYDWLNYITGNKGNWYRNLDDM